MFGLRFAGWATNPNQIALLVLALPLIAWRAIRESVRRLPRLWWWFCAVVSVVTGLATLSDALLLSWLLAASGLFAIWWLESIPNRRIGRVRRWAAVVGLPVLVFGAAVVFARPVAEKTADFFVKDYGEGNQGSDRVNRWRNGLIVAAESPIIGFGPGSFSGPYGPFEGAEAHNTYIDWLDSTGIIGLIAFLALLSWVGVRTVKLHDLTATCFLFAITMFIAFHFVLRQPVFWFDLLVIASARRAE
jgi:O-antigen ligase